MDMEKDRPTHRQKIFKIDDHMAIGISGLTADARVLADYMRNERLFFLANFPGAIGGGMGSKSEAIFLAKFGSKHMKHVTFWLVWFCSNLIFVLQFFLGKVRQSTERM